MSLKPNLPLAAMILAMALAWLFAAQDADTTLAVFTDSESIRLRFEAGRWSCVRSKGYWRKHPGAWPVEALALGGVELSAGQLMEVLSRKPKGDATYLLAQQLIAAKLNAASDVSPEGFEDLTQEADNWLMVNPLGSDPEGEARMIGIALAEELAAFNEGESGILACEDDEDVADSADLGNGEDGSAAVGDEMSAEEETGGSGQSEPGDATSDEGPVEGGEREEQLPTAEGTPAP